MSGAKPGGAWMTSRHFLLHFHVCFPRFPHSRLEAAEFSLRTKLIHVWNKMARGLLCTANSVNWEETTVWMSVGEEMSV